MRRLCFRILTEIAIFSKDITISEAPAVAQLTTALVDSSPDFVTSSFVKAAGGYRCNSDVDKN